jgi:chemotaxis protein MotA
MDFLVTVLYEPRGVARAKPAGQVRSCRSMFAIIGIVLVIGAIVGGYLMEHGHLLVLMQPAELIIIGGASIGTVLIANPLHIL